MKREESKLIQELRQLITDYLNQHPKISIHGLSKRCGVASSTLRRIVMGKTKEEPRGSTVLGIVVAITHENNIRKLIDQFPGEIGFSLRRSYENIIKEPKYLIDLKDVLNDPVAYIVFKMAVNHSGVTLQELVDILGIPAKETVTELKEMGLLYEEMGRLHAYDKSVSLPPQVYKKNMTELIRFTNFGSRFVNSSIFVNYSESINAETYHKIQSIMASSIKEIAKLLRQKENIGEVPFFMTSILDTMEVPSENID